MPIASAGEIQLSYERAGSGPPLLLIMGMSGTFDHWGDAFLGALREHYDTVVYDHRGVGGSSPLEGPITIAQLAEDADALLATLGVDSAHVLGISMGGMIAQELALAHPGRVRTLALGCTYCGGPGSSLTSPQVMGRLAEAMMSGDRERALLAGWRANVSTAVAGDADLRACFLEIGRRRAVAVPVIMAQLQAIIAHDTSARLPGLETGALVVHGSEDQMLPVGNGRLIASHIPGSQLEILDGVGHLFFWEQPQRAAELVRAHAAVAA